MRIAVVGDLGQPDRRVGNMAAAHGVAHALSSRGAVPVLVGREPALLRQSFGPDAAVLPGLRLRWGAGERERSIAEIRRALAGDRDALPTNHPFHRLREHLARCDALVVIGSATAMTARHGWLASEQMATLATAAALGIPSFVTGQSFGPTLSRLDVDHLGWGLGSALGVGVRDEPSAELAASALGLPGVHRVLDDASFLAHLPAAPAAQAPPITPGAVVVTLGPEGLGWQGALLEPIARRLDELAQRLGAPVHLVPHVGDPDRGQPGVGDGDLAVHTQLAALMHSEAVALGQEHALVAARRTREAALVVTNRPQAAVFALEGSVPVLGLALDDVTHRGLRAAPARWGLAPVVLRLPEVAESWFGQVGDALVDQRSATVAALAGRGEALRTATEQFWDLVVDSLQRGQRPEHLHTLPVFAPQVEPGAVGDPDPADDQLRAADDPTGSAEPVGPVPAVSIVMRTKDRPGMLARALEDVAAQAFGDLEVIVVNDGGDPAAVDDAVRRCVGLRGRARVLHRGASTGMEAASNAGVALTRAPLLVIHDDDDTWAPTFLEQTVAYLSAHPQARAVTGRTEIVWEQVLEQQRYPVVEGREGFHATLDEITIGDELRNNHMVPISLLYRRTVHEEIGEYNEALPVVGDWDFNMRLTRLGPVPVVGQNPLAHWRQRRDSTGAMANSVIGQRQDHRSMDRRVRDERLRAYLDTHGDGALLFLTDFIWQHRVTAARQLQQTAESLAQSEQVEALRAEVEELRAGIGRLEVQLSAVADETREAGVVALLRRKYWRLRHRLGRA